jgi:hypothetical protein
MNGFVFFSPILAPAENEDFLSVRVIDPLDPHFALNLQSACL